MTAVMSDDLVERLRVNTCRYAQETEDQAARRRIETDLEAAARIEAQEAEIARLKSDKAAGFAFWRATAKRFAGARRVALTRANQAESALAKAVEVIRPFSVAADDICEQSRDDQHIWEAPCAMNITRGHLRAARDFVKEHDKP